MGEVVVLVSYRSLPGHADTAVREIASLIASVQSLEPACHGITMLQEAGDPTRITLIERWSSQEAFLGPHMQQPHLQAFIQSAGGFLSGPPDISFWAPVGEA